MNKTILIIIGCLIPIAVAIVITSSLTFTEKSEKKVAIFDFDDRLHREGTVAKHIEKSLTRWNPSISIRQFSGKENQKEAEKVLREIDDQEFDLIITVTSDALSVALNQVKNTPVLFTNVNNPRFLGIQNLQEPGNNISGASYYVPIKRQIELFLKVYPDMKKIGMVFDEGNKSRKVEFMEAERVFSLYGLSYYTRLINSEDELESAGNELIDLGVDAIILTSSGLLYNNADKLKEASIKHGVPIFSYHRKAVPKGAVASLSSDYYMMVDRLIVPMAKEVLVRGTNPGKLPVQFLDENLLSLNLSIAKDLNITIPPDLVESADFTY